MCRWEHPGSFCSYGDVGFARAHTGDCWFILDHWVHSYAFPGLWVHPGSLGLFSRVHSSGGWVYSRTLVVFEFTRGLRVGASVSWGRWVYLRGPCESLGSSVMFGFARARVLVVVWFMRDRWIRSCAPLVWLGSSGVVEFIPACPRGSWVHSARWVHSRAPWW